MAALLFLILWLRGLLASRWRLCNTQPPQGLIGILAKRRFRKLGHQFLVIVFRLINLVAGLIGRGKFIRDGGLRVSTAVIKLFVGVDGLLCFPVFLIDRSKRELRHGPDTGIAVTRYLLKVLDCLCRIAKPFLAERDVIQSDAAGR